MLKVTTSLMRNLVATCRLHVPAETCGFIVAGPEDPELGVRIHWMQNVAEKPRHQYVMDDRAVIEAHEQFDRAGEEPLAAFHSHPVTDANLSIDDLTRANPDVTYLVLSLAGPRPVVRAWTVQQFIGNPVAQQVQISVVADNMLDSAALPLAPWALLPGNDVRIGYQRTGKTAVNYTRAVVVSCDHESVHLAPQGATAAKSLALGRIRSVHVFTEGRQARDARALLREHAGRARNLLGGTEMASLPNLLQMLNRAFPPAIMVTMDVQK